MMKSMIKENGVTFKELEKIFMHGSARSEESSQKSSWSGMTGC